jgi:predicted GTPase
MTTFTALRSDALRLFTELGVIAGARKADEAQRQVASARARLEDGRLSVVVCGEFKRGKSSLLNALLEEPGLFPVDSYFATSVITVASYAASESVTVALDDGAGGVTCQQISRDEIASYATEGGNPGNAKKARVITIDTPNSRLSSGLTFIDTPGIGGVYEEHSAVTLEILPSADALLFVTDATQPLAESELEFIAEAARIARVTDDVDGQLFVLTKTDVVDDVDRMLANTKAKLATVTGRPANAVGVIPVSARAKLAYLADGDEDYLEQSNFGELEQALWASLGRRRAKALLAGALGALEAGVQALLEPIETELEALSRNSESDVHDLLQRKKERAAKLAGLGSTEATWRGELHNALDKAERDLRKQGLKDLGDLWTRCHDEFLHKDCYLDDPAKLVQRMAGEAVALTGALNESAERKAAQILRDAARSLRLSVEPPHLGKLPDPPIPVMDLSDDRSSGDRTARGLRALRSAAGATGQGRKVGASVGSAIGMTIGGLVGIFSGPGVVVALGAGFGIGRLIGVALGGTFGIVTAYKDSTIEIKEQEVHARREHLWTELQTMRRKQEEHLGQTIGDLMDVFAAGAETELEDRIAQERESAADTVRRVSVHAASQQARQQRRADLAHQREPLGRIRAEVSDLTAAAARLGGSQ